jgi:hypothetical protein
MIPKIIHQFKWENRDVKSNVLNIKDSNPKWKHKVWTLESVRKIYNKAPENFKVKFDYFVDHGMFLHAEDIAKFWILFFDGGIYIDNGYRFKPKKSLKNISFENTDVVLFNSTIKKNVWRFDESLMACSKNDRFFMHLIDYIGRPEYFPKSQWDGSPLEVYASSYITTHYDLFTRLYNNEPIIKESIVFINDVDKKIVPKNHKILDSNIAFFKNPELVFRHVKNTKFITKQELKR